MDRDSLKKMLERHEGRKVYPYRDTKGKLTIGIGWNMDANPLPSHIDTYLKKNGRITDEMVDLLLDITVDRNIKSAYRLFPGFDGFDTARQNALMDVMLMGEKKIRTEFPMFVAAVNREDWQRAADEIKYGNGLTKDRFSKYWVQLKGDPDGQEDGRETRPEEIYRLLSKGE